MAGIIVVSLRSNSFVSIGLHKSGFVGHRARAFGSVGGLIGAAPALHQRPREWNVKGEDAHSFGGRWGGHQFSSLHTEITNTQLHKEEPSELD